MTKAQPVFNTWGFTRDDGWWIGRSGYCMGCKKRYTAKSGDEVWARGHNRDSTVLCRCPHKCSGPVFIRKQHCVMSRFFDWIDAHV